MKLLYPALLPIRRSAARCYADAPTLRLPTCLVEAIEARALKSREQLARLKTQPGIEVGTATVQTTIGGMRGANMLVCETSVVDPQKGLFYRGRSVSELVTQMPCNTPTTRKPGDDISSSVQSPPLSEGLLWLLLTGSIPEPEEAELLRLEMVNRMRIPDHVTAVIAALPPTTHPMTQLIAGIAACQTESSFAKMYTEAKIPRSDFWKYTLDDGLSLLAKMPILAGMIYRRISNRADLDKRLPNPDTSLDWSGNISRMLGFESKEMQAVLRLYMFLHADHEGGNVSAHAAHLVGSALSDPYLAFAASMSGLAGPLHGLANQECLRFFKRMQQALSGDVITEDAVRAHIQKNVLGKGMVVPGFGHAVLRVTDPRFLLQNQFAKEMMSDDELFKLLSITVEVVPPLLKATGKVSSPYPNIDAHSGVILSHFGLHEDQFYTVLFGVSRCLGIVSQLVWDRLLHLPIERPKSITLDELCTIVAHSGNSP